MPNTVRLHRVLAMKREKVYHAFIEPDPMVPTWRPGHFQAAPLWQPVGRSGLTVFRTSAVGNFVAWRLLARTTTFANDKKRPFSVGPGPQKPTFAACQLVRSSARAAQSRCI